MRHSAATVQVAVRWRPCGGGRTRSRRAGSRCCPATATRCHSARAAPCSGPSVSRCSSGAAPAAPRHTTLASATATASERARARAVLAAAPNDIKNLNEQNVHKRFQCSNRSCIEGAHCQQQRTTQACWHGRSRMRSGEADGTGPTWNRLRHMAHGPQPLLTSMLITRHALCTQQQP